MRFLKLYRGEKHYENISSDYAYQMLGSFLDETTHKDAEIFVAGDFTLAVGTVHTIRKEGTNIIVRYNYMDMSDEAMLDSILANEAQGEDGEITFSQKDFVHLCDAWLKFLEVPYKEFWIKDDNGVFWCEMVG